MVIAPHPDDETLGCGGAILRHIDRDDDVYWLIMTTMKGSSIFTEEQVAKREKEIEIERNRVAMFSRFAPQYQHTLTSTFKRTHTNSFHCSIDAFFESSCSRTNEHDYAISQLP